MNNNLLHVSAVALQKSLEREANAATHVDQGEPRPNIEEEQPASILSRLFHKFDRTKTAQPQMVAPKLKNKIV